MKLLVISMLLATTGAFDLNESIPCGRDLECQGTTGTAGTCVSGSCVCSNGYKKAANTEVCVWVGDDFNMVRHTFLTMILFPEAKCNATNAMVLEMYNSIWEGTSAISDVTYRICDRAGLMMAVRVNVSLYGASVVFGKFNNDLDTLLSQNSSIITNLMKTNPSILTAARSAIFGSTFNTALLNSMQHNCINGRGFNTSFPFDGRCHALTCDHDHNLGLNRSVTEEWWRYYSCEGKPGPLTGWEIFAISVAVVVGFACIAAILYVGVAKDAFLPLNDETTEEGADKVEEGRGADDKIPEPVKSNEPIN